MRTRVWDIVALIEACYRIEQTEQAWLEGCAEAARPFIDRGLGHIALTYELARSGEQTFPARVIAGPSDERNAPDLLKRIPLELVRAWRSGAAGFASEEPSHSLQDEASRRGNELPDGFLAMGIEFDDCGCVLGGRVAHPGLTASQRDVWLRLVAHLGAGYRLRRMLEQSRGRPNAVVDRGWKALHANGEKRSAEAMRKLREPFQATGEARACQIWWRREESSSSLQTLLSGHWTLFGLLEPDGRRFVAVQGDRPRQQGRSGLSARERQALGLLLLKQSNKEIAFALGVSASTAGVLLHRAAQKLGTRTRTELVARAKALDTVSG